MIRLTAKDVERLGLRAKARRPRRAPEPYHTRCCRCGVEFTVRKAETVHLDETGHPRYEAVL